jgi:hypothetical protein
MYGRALDVAKRLYSTALLFIERDAPDNAAD